MADGKEICMHSNAARWVSILRNWPPIRFAVRESRQGSDDDNGLHVRRGRVASAAWRLWRASLLFALGSSSVMAQTFRATEGNAYSGRSTTSEQTNECVTQTTVDRSVIAARDQGANRLTYTMSFRRERRARYVGSDRVARIECGAGLETSTAVARFYLDNESASRTDYSATVIEASRTATGFQLGERISGQIEVFDGGRGLDFSNETFIGGTARVLAESFRNAAGPEQRYFVPNRAPDVVLSCRVISADGSTETTNRSGTDSVNGSYSSSSTRNSSCLAYGWQNLRKSTSVWLAEKRCDGYACRVEPTRFSWEGGSVNRVTGQMRDSCYVYECEKTSQTPRF